MSVIPGCHLRRLEHREVINKLSVYVTSRLFFLTRMLKEKQQL